MKIPYLIMVCTVLLVSGAISVGSTDILGKAGEKTSITGSREGMGWPVDDETTHRQVRLHRTVKKDAANKAASIPVVMITGQVASQALAAWARACLYKPFGCKEFENILRSMLGRASLRAVASGEVTLS